MKKICQLLILFVLTFGITFAPLADPGSPAARPSLGEAISRTLPMFVMVLVLFHFLIIRPQKNKEITHAALIKGLKNGDSVVTSGGLIGRVVNITPEIITLEVAQNVRLKFESQHIIKTEAVASKA